ncbi:MULTISPECIES: MBL fold metallo-hydrolase [Congzhengia]|jgi:phosphoribosyl 1,2-cyclic phosphodiesterase|uniref:MBL fold metallo-hydrolase n=1 Tax=Congzhengia minquanensis TaxID=2763657 RepID=A0A926HZB4_9FIRM|nr:MBL fold metallo-hydrolase [Congzhengia minquanensis]MBC8540995.1 MBL fold metallo-hydrolase [Congzhengia minquanensis]
MVKFQSFLSSSSGNSTFITDDHTNILIDCGATKGYIEKCLSRLGTDGTHLSGIFITHAHIDHIAAAGTLSRKFGLPLYATAETFAKGARQIGMVREHNLREITPGDDITVNTLTVHAFSIPHDADGAVSYTVTDGESKFGIATDSGIITDEIMQNLTGCDTVIVESNHDVDMLRRGPYPYPLKKRILGEGGHLSNDMCGQLCAALAKCGTRAFWLGHLSDKNNLPDLAYSCVSRVLAENGITVGCDVSLNVIPKFWIEATI